MGYGTEDGWEIDYGVIEEVPKPKAPVPNDNNSFVGFVLQPYKPSRADDDLREGALLVDAGSIEVHHVEWVKVNSTRFSVSRRRYEK